jgi:formylglycine-generating enzyme required for sulfatase activity
MKIPLTISLRLAVLAGISLVTPAFAVVSIDYASIGNAGNANDAATGSLYGAVAYTYQIAKNETTIAQYAEFLNAVAKTDSYGLYNASMTTSYINGITQSGSSGSFTYSVNPGSGNKPITYVSWFDAARFCNWLQNGQPEGAQDASSTEDGAYTLLGAMSGIIEKNGGAKAWIPTESEWYKAAYYDPNKGGVGVGGYWAQATQSNTLAGNTIGVAGSANYWNGNFVGYPVAALTNVGAYGVNSQSAYGTNDQAGNVWEWNDGIFSWQRGQRGGSWSNVVDPLASSFQSGNDPSFEDILYGFRVASVPEPTSLVLTMLAGSVMLIRRKR